MFSHIILELRDNIHHTGATTLARAVRGARRMALNAAEQAEAGMPSLHAQAYNTPILNKPTAGNISVADRNADCERKNDSAIGQYQIGGSMHVARNGKYRINGTHVPHMNKQLRCYPN
jgi:hypothetical protein